jgi:hypothetical protein
MLKISIFETCVECRLVLEGKLMTPWVTELEKTWKALAAELGGHALVIDVENLTLISAEGENAILELMRHGATFRCRGVFAKHIVQQLRRRYKRSVGDRGCSNT